MNDIKQNPGQTPRENVFAWAAPEFRYYEKTMSWYFWSIGITVLIIIFAIWQKNFLFAFFAIVGELLIVFWAQQMPKEFDHRLTEQGLEFNNRRYLFSNYDAFAVIDDSLGSPYSEIILRPKKHLAGYTKALVHDEQAEAVRTWLVAHLPEFDYDEPLSDHLLKRMKF